MSLYITKVKKDARDVIQECFIEQNNDWYTKQAIVNHINERNTVYSKDQFGNTAKVKVIRNEHLSTTPDDITSNNLDNLPVVRR